MQLVVDLYGALMLFALVKRVDLLTVALVVTQAYAPILMMLELLVILLVSKLDVTTDVCHLMSSTLGLCFLSSHLQQW